MPVQIVGRQVRNALRTLGGRGAQQEAGKFRRQKGDLSAVREHGKWFDFSHAYTADVPHIVSTLFRRKRFFVALMLCFMRPGGKNLHIGRIPQAGAYKRQEVYANP